MSVSPVASHSARAAAFIITGGAIFRRADQGKRAAIVCRSSESPAAPSQQANDPTRLASAETLHGRLQFPPGNSRQKRDGIDSAEHDHAAGDDPEQPFEGSADYGCPAPAADRDDGKPHAACDKGPRHLSCALARKVERHAEAIECIKRCGAMQIVDTDA